MWNECRWNHSRVLLCTRLEWIREPQRFPLGISFSFSIVPHPSYRTGSFCAILKTRSLYIPRSSSTSLDPQTVGGVKHTRTRICSMQKWSMYASNLRSYRNTKKVDKTELDGRTFFELAMRTHFCMCASALVTLFSIDPCVVSTRAVSFFSRLFGMCAWEIKIYVCKRFLVHPRQREKARGDIENGMNVF